MERIPLNATDVQVTQAIASILHNPNGPFIALSPDRLINFRVHLFRDQRKNRPHYGKGALTIPTPAVGELLLRNWPNIEVRGAFISLSRSRRAPRQDVLEEIRRIPYIDLTELRIREERLGKLTGNVSVSLLQFGWECRDGVWSAEWESRGSWSLSMDDDNRRIILRLSAVGSIKTKIVHLRYSHIKWIGRDLHSSPRIMFLSLDFPPMFGTQDALVFDSSHTEVLAFFGLPDVIALDAITNKIHQTSFLDEEHEHVAPYTSTSLVLHCRSSEDAALFVKFCGIIGKGIENQQCTIEQRGLFSTQHMEMMHEWLQNLPRSVAFGVDAILRSTIADPQELLSIQPIINGLIGGTRKDNEYVAEILKQLTIRLKNWDWREGEDESEESAQDQSATVKPPRLQTVKEILEHIIESTRKKDIPAPSQRAPGVFDCWHVQVTPTAVLIEGLFPERSNRVIRTYPGAEDYFLRVSFKDETSLQFRFEKEIDGQQFVRDRVGGLAKGHLIIGGRKFFYLGYSMSALKEHAVWFMSPFLHSDGTKVTPESIRSSLGTFTKVLKCPSLYGARMSQAFSATEPSVTVESAELILIDDIERNGSCFTDGVGTISTELAGEIWRLQHDGRLRRKSRGVHPRTFQIRFGGSKGMLSVDYKLQGRVLCIRPSMTKFDSPSLAIEIAKSFEKPTKMVLNRPMIMLLEGLGVDAKHFLDLQRSAVQETKSAAEEISSAIYMMESYGLGTSFKLGSVWNNLSRKLDLSFRTMCSDEDLFTMRILDYSVNHVIRELKHHARIPVPNSWTLPGVADVHDYLQEGEIFACVQELPDHPSLYLEGVCLITRSPVIHPGDVQMVRAIGKPPKGSPYDMEPLKNSVVFSVKGQRSLPSCLGGGDLDGDLYNIITLPELFPKNIHSPAEYPPVQRKMLDRDSTIDDVIDFVVEYINSDVLGLIAINWLIIADQSTEGILDPDCMVLAGLHSDAVDYQKSGMPVKLEKIPRTKFQARPDWNRPETGSTQGRFYDSQRAIGKLYRDIDLSADIDALKNAREQRKQIKDEIRLDVILADSDLGQDAPIDPVSVSLRLLVEEWVKLDNKTRIKEHHTILEAFETYRKELQYLCQTNTLSNKRNAMITEEEVVVGTIVAKCSQPRQRRDAMARLRERSGELVTTTKADIFGGGDNVTGLERSLQRAWFAWEVADRGAKHDLFGARSFGIIALGAIFEVLGGFDNSVRP